MKKNKFHKFLVWLLAIVMFIPGIVQIPVENVHAASVTDKAKAAYGAFLMDAIDWGDESRKPSDVKFGISDLNNDKIPELYVYTKKWDYYYAYKLYGYVNGKVKELYSIRRNLKLVKVYPSTGTILINGDLGRGRAEKIYLQYNGKTLTPKAGCISSSFNNFASYNNGSSKQISKSAFSSIVSKLTKGSSKGAPALYSNTATYRTRYLKTSPSSKILFEKGYFWAFTNGGFYLRITSISRNKMKVSIKMPNMTRNSITATISSSGRYATAKFTCADGISHTLKFSVGRNSVNVKEISKCSDKLLSSTDYDGYEDSLYHSFKLDNCFSAY